MESGLFSRGLLLFYSFNAWVRSGSIKKTWILIPGEKKHTESATVYETKHLPGPAELVEVKVGDLLGPQVRQFPLVDRRVLYQSNQNMTM